MKTALEYTLDLERDLNLMDGLDDRAHKMPHTHDGEAYVTITGSLIIEHHIKNIIEEVRRGQQKSWDTIIHSVADNSKPL